MRSFPTCWNRTLAQLRLQAKTQQNEQRGYTRRRPQFETLEPRQMMAADIYTVTTLTDVVDANDGLTSLREALTTALTDDATDDNDIINFDASLSNGTLSLTQGQLVIDSDVSIDGLGSDQLTIDAQQNSRVFLVNSDVTATIEGLTITGGKVTGGINGGGIYSSGDLTLREVDILYNESSNRGGGLFMATGGSLLVIDSTFDHNIARFGAGARVDTAGSGPVTIQGSTFSYNEDSTLDGTGGGLLSGETLPPGLKVP